jgi:hypothetical protein
MLTAMPFLIKRQERIQSLLSGSDACWIKKHGRSFFGYKNHVNADAKHKLIRYLLGFPDATVVAAPFGIYVADDVQKVQFVLLSNCRDETATRHALQRFIEWLDVAGEAADLVERARSRKRIVLAIAKEAGIAGN